MTLKPLIQKKIKFEDAVAIFQEALGVLDSVDGSLYIPFVRSDWGSDFDDMVMDDLIGSMYDFTQKARIKEKVNDTNVHTIDFALGRNTSSGVESVWLFRNDDANHEVSVSLVKSTDRDEDKIWSITMTNCVTDEEHYLIPLSYLNYNFNS